MRNTVKVIDKEVPKVTILSLESGQMFRYPKGANDQNVYMAMWHKTLGQAVVLLSTGAMYTDFDQSREIEVIDAISIQR